MMKASRLFYFKGKRYEPGDLFDDSKLSVGQAASVRRLYGLVTYNPYKRKKKTKTKAALPQIGDTDE
jgi:hypothetical protein